MREKMLLSAAPVNRPGKALAWAVTRCFACYEGLKRVGDRPYTFQSAAESISNENRHAKSR